MFGIASEVKVPQSANDKDDTSKDMEYVEDTSESSELFTGIHSEYACEGG